MPLSLEPDITVVGEAGSGERAVALLTGLREGKADGSWLVQWILFHRLAMEVLPTLNLP